MDVIPTPAHGSGLAHCHPYSEKNGGDEEEEGECGTAGARGATQSVVAAPSDDVLAPTKETLRRTFLGCPKVRLPLRLSPGACGAGTAQGVAQE